MENYDVEKLKSDDEASFEEVYHRYNKILFAHFNKRIQSRTMSEDLIQETFMGLSGLQFISK